jgi:dolichol-phosphate mannosyltransferase
MPTKTSISFAVVVPMYNEAQGAEKCVRAICAALDSFTYRTALIVIDDGSYDETRNILARLQPEHSRLIVVTHEQNSGYGSALRTGARRAADMSFDYVLFMDSDLTNDPRYLPLFVAKMQQDYDVIKASRYVSGGGVVGVPAWRTAISIAGNRIASILYGLSLHDCTNGFRAVKIDILRQMHLHERGFAIIMEELYQAKFLAKTFCEVPYTLTARTQIARPSSFIYRPQIFYSYLKYAVKSFFNRAPSEMHSNRSVDIHFYRGGR